MPLLRPEVKQNPTLELMREVLKSDVSPKSERGSRARQALEDSGLSIEAAALHLADIVSGTQDDSTKLKALDTALKIHGAMEPEKSQGNQIQVNFLFDGNMQSAMDILRPR
jgi:hypothetical protein